MSIVLQSSGGGSVTLQEPVTASNLTITVPAVTGTMALTASPTFTGTATIPTATITTLNAPSGVLATQNGMTGIAKAWVRFTVSGNTPTIAASFNVSSVTYVSGGRFTITFTTAMPSGNYAVAGSTNSATVAVWGGTQSTTSFDTFTGTNQSEYGVAVLGA
jgi:hypothetical protein